MIWLLNVIVICVVAFFYIYIGTGVSSFSDSLHPKHKYNIVRLVIVLFWPIYLVLQFGFHFILWLFTKE